MVGQFEIPNILIDNHKENLGESTNQTSIWFGLSIDQQNNRGPISKWVDKQKWME